MAVSDQEIQETYLRYFRELNSSVEAALQTATYLVPEGGDERQRVWARVRMMMVPLEMSIGDPWRLAVQSAIDKLEAEGAPSRMREAWAKAAAEVSERVSVKDWDPDKVEARLSSLARRPWMILHFDPAGVLQKWEIRKEHEEHKIIFDFKPGTKIWPIRRDTTVESLRPAISELLSFIRTRYQRGRAREGGHPTRAIYPHELVASLLPPNAEYVTRWAIPEDWARKSTEELFAMPGAVALQKEIERDHATIRVPDLVFLEQLLNILAERKMISDRLLGDDVVQVATEFWDARQGRWVAVSEVVAAFDEIEPRR